MAKRVGKKRSLTHATRSGGVGASPRYRDFKARLEVLTALAEQLRIDCKSELEKAGDDPIAGIAVLTHVLGLDVMSVLNPATNLNDLVAARRN